MRKLGGWADLAGSAGHIYGQAGTSLTTGRTSKDRRKVGKRVLDILKAWAHIYKRLRSPEIDSANLCSMVGRYDKKKVVVPARQARNRLLGSLKGLQIRALDF